MILAGNDTEKLGGYQGKIMPVSGVRVIDCPSEADEHLGFTRLYDFRLKCSIDEQIQENNSSGRTPHPQSPGNSPFPN